jgi:hypothetical protein
MLGRGGVVRAPGRPLRDNGAIMTVLVVLLFPVLLMIFAVLMERLEARLQNVAVTEDEIEEFLDHAQPEEVNTFVREGWTRALAVFRLRRKPKNRRRKAPKQR